MQGKPRPLFRGADMPRGEERAWAWPKNGGDKLAGPRRRVRGQNRHAGWRHRGQESRAALGKRDTGKSEIRRLDVDDRWIAHRRHPSWSCSVMHAQIRVEVLPQLSGHWTNEGVQGQNIDYRTRAWRGDREEGHTAETWSGDHGSLQRLTGRNSTDGTLGDEPTAATGETDQQQSAEWLPSRHCN